MSTSEHDIEQRQKHLEALAAQGDVAGLREHAAELHPSDLADLVASNDIDLVFAAGEMRELYDRLPPGIGAAYGETGSELIEEIRLNVRTGDIVMIKGSNAGCMTAVVEALLDAGAKAENE